MKRTDARANYAHTRPAHSYRFTVKDAQTGENLGKITVKPSELHGRTPQQVANGALSDYHRNAYAVPG